MKRSVRSRPGRIDGNLRRKYLILRRSGIHSRGVFARREIPKGTRILEYVGEKITKAESLRRVAATELFARKDPRRGAVYIVDLNRRYDLDGRVRRNYARFVNHSCDPNCDLYDIGGRLWIIARRRIRAGDELSYDYGYSLDVHRDHPCRCGSPSCIGYIVARRHWHRILEARTLEERRAAAAGRNGTDGNGAGRNGARRNRAQTNGARRNAARGNGAEGPGGN